MLVDVYSYVFLLLCGAQQSIIHVIFVSQVVFSNVHHFALVRIEAYSPSVSPFAQTVQDLLQFFNVCDTVNDFPAFGIIRKFDNIS
jgi:hypothetical protein